MTSDNLHAICVPHCSAGGKFSIVGSGSLRISRVSQSDEGVYTCRGDNLEEISDAEATLSVKGMSSSNQLLNI